MNRDNIISGEKLTILILNLSVIGLIFISLFPMISVSENDAVKDELYFNYEMIKHSNNDQINSLADNLNLISIIFWAIIIVSVISYLSLTFFTFLKKGYSSLITIISMILLILGISVIIFQYNFISSVGNSNIASLSSIASSFCFIHITLLIGILILICSIVFVLIFVLDLTEKLISSRKRKKISETPSKQTSDEPVSPTLKTVKKKVEMEKWLKDEIKNIDENTNEAKLIPIKEERIEQYNFSTEKPKIVEKEELDVDRISLEPSRELEKITTSDDKRQIGPFHSEKIEEKPKESSELKISPSFENALSSAIKKKQGELGKKRQIIPESKEIINEKEELITEIDKDTSKKEEIGSKEKEVITTEIIVKCPQCKNIFAVKKEGKTTKIKCPECGKEGIAQ